MLWSNLGVFKTAQTISASSIANLITNVGQNHDEIVKDIWRDSYVPLLEVASFSYIMSNMPCIHCTQALDPNDPTTTISFMDANLDYSDDEEEEYTFDSDLESESEFQSD